MSEIHIDHFKHKLFLIQRDGETLEQKKPFFSTIKIHFLGHIIRPRTLKITSHIDKAIKKLNRPRNITKSLPFLRLCNTSWRFVQNVARKTASINRKVRKINLKSSISSSTKNSVQWELFRKSLIHLPFQIYFTLEDISNWTQTDEMCDSAVCSTRTARLHSATNWWLWVSISEKYRESIGYHSIKMLSNRVVYCPIATIPKKYAARHPNGSQLVWMDPKLSTFDRKTFTLATPSNWIQLWGHKSCSRTIPSRRCHILTTHKRFSW